MKEPREAPAELGAERPSSRPTVRAPDSSEEKALAAAYPRWRGATMKTWLVPREE